MMSHLGHQADINTTSFDRIIHWRRPIEYLN